MQKKLVWVILAILVLFNLARTVPLMTAGLPPGGDNASHIGLLIGTIESLKDGVLWNENYNAGFPMFFYYNPLAFVLLALINVLTGISAIALYKAALVILFAIVPLSFYLASRWMKLSETVALFAALSSTVFSSFINFGIEPFAFFGFGLFAELWAVALAPFVIASVYRSVHMQKSVFLASLLLTVLFVTHVLAGYIIALFSVLFLFVDGFNWRKAARLTLIGIGMLIGISFLLFPALLHKDYYGGMPFDYVQRTDGYGFDGLKQTLQGKLLDNERLPVLSVFALVGLIIAFRKKGLPRFFALGVILSVLFLMGRAAFGSVFNFIPGLADVQLFRFVIAAHIFSAFLVGFGAEWISEFFSKRFKLKHLHVIGVLLILFLPVLWHSYTYMSTIKPFPEMSQEPGITQLLNGIKINAVGRTDARRDTFYSRSVPVIAIPIFTGKPLAFTSGAGSHDSLTYYYLNAMQQTEEHLRLFNVEYVLITEKIDKYSGRNVLVKVGNSSYFELVHADIAVDGSNKDARNVVLAWMYSKLLSAKEYLLIGESDAKIKIELTDDSRWKPDQNLDGIISIDPSTWQIRVDGGSDVPALLYFGNLNLEKRKPCGVVSDEKVERGQYSADFDVKDSGCYALLKVSAFPEWHAYVDSVEVQWKMLSPSFMGVPLETGKHTVEFKYSVMPLRKWLLLVSVVGLIALYFLDRKYLFKI